MWAEYDSERCLQTPVAAMSNESSIAHQAVPPESDLVMTDLVNRLVAGVAADLLVWTHSAFHSRLHLRASQPSTISTEGLLMYGEAVPPTSNPAKNGV